VAHCDFFKLAPALTYSHETMVPMVRESQGKLKYQGAKVYKDAEKILNSCTQTAYNSSKFFLLASLANYLYLHF